MEIIECPEIIHYNGHWIRYWKAGDIHPIHGRLDVARLVVDGDIFKAHSSSRDIKLFSFWQDLNMYGISLLKEKLSKIPVNQARNDAVLRVFGLDQKPSCSCESHRKANGAYAKKTSNAIMNERAKNNCGSYLIQDIDKCMSYKYTKYPENGADV